VIAPEAVKLTPRLAVPPGDNGRLYEMTATGASLPDVQNGIEFE
jgi:hypothetical protein